MKEKILDFATDFFLPLLLTMVVLTAGAIGISSYLTDTSLLKADLTPETGRKIVVFKPGVGDVQKENLVKKAKGKKLKHLKLINATAIDITSKKDTEVLLASDEVLRIDEDILVYLDSKKKGNKNNPKLQETPWGVTRVGAIEAREYVNGPRPKIAIIDTGIDLDHPDLSANIKGAFNTIDPSVSADDDHGHGSHVAGTIGAIDNKFGVVGVGPKIKLYAAKAIRSNGSGYLSDIIEGIDWAIENEVDVINMSLSTPANIPAFYEAVKKAYEAGVVVVGSAGNSRRNVFYPAAYPEVIAVSATDPNDGFAWFSNRGPQISVSAPGVYVYSTDKDGGYISRNGTSMAVPHVAAAAALIKTTFVGLYDQNGNGKWDPAEVQLKLEETAEDLGQPGKDPYFGAGLLDVAAALQ